MKIDTHKGLIAAPFTPMNADCSVNIGAIEAYAAHLKQDGVKGVFVCGTTGEGMLMTSEERKIVAEEWVRKKSEDFHVIIHVGSTSAKQSADLAAHAQQIGADAVGCMGPSFLPPASVSDLVSFCKVVADQAPDLPFYYYHIPSISGVNLSMVDFLQQAKEQLPNLAGIKYTHNNFMEMMQCMRMDGGKWDILHGYDELLLGGLSFGVKGAVGSTYNYAAPLYLGILADFEAGNLEAAREKQFTSIKMVEVLIKYNGALTAGKAIMKLRGIDCGPCRTPLKTLSEEEYSDLVRELEQLELLNTN